VSAKAQSLLWIAQRASAALLALCVIVHLVTIIYAVQGGLSAAEIFGRTRGNVAWFIFYSIFVLGVAVHAPIGLRSVFIEWLGWRGKSRDVALLLFSFLLLVMGMRAVLALFT
jgi:fumarate reductase subunit C